MVGFVPPQLADTTLVGWAPPTTSFTRDGSRLVGSAHPTRLARTAVWWAVPTLLDRLRQNGGFRAAATGGHNPCRVGTAHHKLYAGWKSSGGQCPPYAFGTNRSLVGSAHATRPSTPKWWVSCRRNWRTQPL